MAKKYPQGNQSMKNLNISLVLILFLLILSFQTNAGELANNAKLESEALNIVKKFAGTLKPKLKKAIQTGGLEQAIELCSIEAPKIAANLSEKTGWSVKRVSLKPRNKNNASPDSFEQKILEQFNKRQIKGESLSAISYSEVVDNKFRFMKAQGVEGICLNCHGKSIDQNVKKIINKHYPKDIATGYSLGQIRGAFSLIKNL